MTRIDGAVVWVTGASSGIGEAIAYAFAERGASLILSARREAELERVRGACADPSRVRLLPLDLAEADRLAERVREAEALFGRVDVLINNGGISQRSLALETSLEVDRRLMEVNYFGTVGLTKAVLPAMVARGAGHVAVVTSVTGKFGTPYRSGYSASKHALHGFFEALRAEVWRDGVRVSLVAPGFVRTQVSVNALTGDGTPLGSMDEGQAGGISAAACAGAVVGAVARDRDEVVVGGARERFGVGLKRFAPGLFARVIRKAAVR